MILTFTYIVLNDFVFDQDVVSSREKRCVLRLSATSFRLLSILSFIFLLRSFLYNNKRVIK